MFTIRKALTLSLAAAGIAAAAPSAAQAGWTAPVQGTCIDRSSDGARGCWYDGESPSQMGIHKLQTAGCLSYQVTYLDSPYNQHGVVRTPGILAVQAGLDQPPVGSFTEFAATGWTGVGGTVLTQQPAGTSETPIRLLRVHVGAPNSYARVQVQAWGPGNCNWF